MTIASPLDTDGRCMLDELGFHDPDQLFEHIPESLRASEPLDIPGPLTEPELRRYVASLAAQDLHADSALCFAGGGIYDHYRPAIVDAIIQRGEFLTSYTSYQPEISQGMLVAMYEFQTMVCELYGLDVANASVYDAGTGLVEAALMAADATRRDRVVLAGAINPRYERCIRTALPPSMEDSIITCPHREGCVEVGELSAALDDSVACIIVQQPSFVGAIADLSAVIEEAHAVGAMAIVCADPLAMGVLEAPGTLGADIVVGEGQGLGIPMGFGGPGLGLLAAKRELVRRLPGRIVGRTVDCNGDVGYVLTLQTREQHIRREKATSNICTNQGLCALAATVYLSTLGPRGLRRLGSLCVVRSHQLRDAVAQAGLTPLYDSPFFKEFAVRSPIPVPELQRAMGERGFIIGGDISGVTGVENSLLLCATEQRTERDIEAFAQALREVL